jgi:hypothetical protein
MKSLLIMARSCLDSFYADLRQIRGERPFDRLVDKYYPRDPPRLSPATFPHTTDCRACRFITASDCSGR